MKRFALLFLLVACKPQPSVAPADAAAVVIDAAPPPDAPIAAIPRPPGASFACGPETCHAQQYCRRVTAGKGEDRWSTIACAAVPEPCRETPDCACLGRYGIVGFRCKDVDAHAVVDVSY